MRCAVDDVLQLEKLLKLFFAFERAEIADFRRAVAQFKTDLPAVLEALRGMIATRTGGQPGLPAAAENFLAHAQEAINPALTEADVREMLIQHILTEEIFGKVFDDSDFHRQNNVAHELYALEATFFTGNVKRATLKGLEGPITPPSAPRRRRSAGGARQGRIVGRREAQDWGRRAQRASMTDSPHLFERSERSERSESCGATPVRHRSGVGASATTDPR